MRAGKGLEVLQKGREGLGGGKKPSRKVEIE